MIPAFTIHVTNNAMATIICVCLTLAWVAWTGIRRRPPGTG